MIVPGLVVSDDVVVNAVMDSNYDKTGLPDPLVLTH
jgi:hypothetical protein